MSAYIGREPTLGNLEVQVLPAFNGTLSTVNLNYAVGSASSLLVVLNGVLQQPSVAYSVSLDGTVLTFAEPPIAESDGYIIYLGKQISVPRSVGQTVDVQSFAGNNVQTAFVLQEVPVVPEAIIVVVDGLIQKLGTNFTLSGSTLSFVVAPPLGAEIEVIFLAQEKVSIDTVRDQSITRVKFAPGALVAEDVVYNGTTIEDTLDAQLLQDYAALRAYAGFAKTVRITGLIGTAQPQGIAGFFQFDPTDTTSLDNGGTIIVGVDGRRWKRVFTGSVNIQWFGIKGDGTGEVGQYIQAAHAALGPDGGEIYIPAGVSNYPFETSVSFTKPIKLKGDGWYNSELLTRVNTGVLISSTAKLDVEDLHFTALDSARNACTFLFHAQSSATHGYSTIRSNYFDGALRAYRSASTNSIVVESNVFGIGENGQGLYLENLVNPDTGDSFVTNNTFSGASTAIGIQVFSTAGINICNNKFNNELAHILISAGTNVIGNFLISNNSFEGHTDYAIKSEATSGTVTKLLINGNQFSATSTTHVVVGNATQNTVIGDNTFNHTSALSGTGVTIEDGAREITITGNAFHQILNAVVGPSSGQPVGLTMRSNRFASDVTTILSGDDGVNAFASDKEVVVSDFVSNASDVTFVDICRFQGQGTLEILAYGVVQGVGNTVKQRKVLFTNTTIAAIDAETTIGAAFDMQVAAAGGFMVVSAKRAAGIGSSITLYVEVKARGQITLASRV